jgi:eukaryotic-like serine/threonine-protein kinase
MLVASRDDLVRGTPAYMSPEQIRGEAADRRSDVFAFGILLYEMVSGINPFRRASIETTFAAILREPIATLHDRMPAIPPSIDALLVQLLSKDPAARHHSLGDVRTSLRRLSVDISSSAATLRRAVVDHGTRDTGARLIGRDGERSQLRH